MSLSSRAILLILDGTGCGELPDAAQYGDQGSNTLGNLSRHFEDGLRLPNLQKLGLGNIIPIRGVPPRGPRNPNSSDLALASFGKCAEKSAGKDSTSGHWEVAGIISNEPFPTYPNGFPREIIDSFIQKIGRGILGNKPASGTEIIEDLGEEHLRTGKPIVYTSADSVFQIAGHNSIYPIEELYKICQIARDLLTGPHRVGRVIARPFTGYPGQFQRTAARRDFSVEPPKPTLLNRCQEAGIKTIGVGKIGDLFAHCGLDEEIHTKSNNEGMATTLQQMQKWLRHPAADLRQDAEAPQKPIFIFTNLVEGDSVYGHRNDCAGYRKCLEEFDARLSKLMAVQQPGDLMVIAADHGVDPTTPSTDHSREYIPLLAWGEGFRKGVDLGTRSTFADIGQTIADYLGAEPLPAGESFLREILSH